MFLGIKCVPLLEVSLIPIVSIPSNREARRCLNRIVVGLSTDARPQWLVLFSLVAEGKNQCIKTGRDTMCLPQIDRRLIT